MTLRFWITNTQTRKTRGPYTSLAKATENLGEMLEIGDAYTIDEAPSASGTRRVADEGTFGGWPEDRQVTGSLQPAEQPSVNRLIVGTQSLKIESSQPVGAVSLDTPSGFVILERAIIAECRYGRTTATYVVGELAGSLVGARAEPRR